MGAVNSVLRHAVVQGKNYVYDVGSLSWVAMTQPSSSGGGGDASAANQALEIAALGATTDAEAAANGSIIAVLKRIRTLLANPLTDTQLRATPVPVSGTVTASGPLTDTQLRATAVPVSVAATLATKEVRAATSAVTTVSDTASNATLLASNANRLGASIQNTSSAALCVKFGTTATTSDFTVRLARYDYLEVPAGYTGRIDGIWETDPNDGAAKITELTA